MRTHHCLPKGDELAGFDPQGHGQGGDVPNPGMDLSVLDALEAPKVDGGPLSLCRQPLAGQLRRCAPVASIGLTMSIASGHPRNPSVSIAINPLSEGATPRGIAWRDQGADEGLSPDGGAATSLPPPPPSAETAPVLLRIAAATRVETSTICL